MGVHEDGSWGAAALSRAPHGPNAIMASTLHTHTGNRDAPMPSAVVHKICHFHMQTGVNVFLCTQYNQPPDTHLTLFPSSSSFAPIPHLQSRSSRASRSFDTIQVLHLPSTAALPYAVQNSLVRHSLPCDEPREQAPCIWARNCGRKPSRSLPAIHSSWPTRG